MGFGLVGQGGWGIQHGRAIMEEGADLALGGGGLGRASSGSHSPECALLSRPGLGTSAHGRPGRSQPPTRRLCPSVPRGRVSCLARTIDGNLRQRRRQVAACVARVGTYYEMRFSPLWCAVRDLIRSRPGDWQRADLSLERHPFRPGRSAWRCDATRVGDWIIEEAVHHLDLLGCLGAKETIAVRVWTDLPASRPPYAYLLVARLHYSDGAMATYRSTLCGEGHYLVFHTLRTVWVDSGRMARRHRPIRRRALRRLLVSGRRRGSYPGSRRRRRARSSNCAAKSVP